MDSVVDLIEPVKLEVRANADDYKEGKRIVEAHGVMLEGANPLKVTAKVSSPGGPTQHAELASVPGGLRWSCTCNEQHLFCPHVIAAAMVAWEKAPRRRYNKPSGGPHAGTT